MSGLLGALGGLGQGMAQVGQQGMAHHQQMERDEKNEERQMRIAEFQAARQDQRDEVNHTRTMERDANKSQLVNDGRGNVNQVRGNTATPVMTETRQDYQMPEGSYFDEEDRQQAGGGLLSVSQEQLNVGTKNDQKDPTVKTFFDKKTGREYVAQFNRQTEQWDPVGGVKAPDKDGGGRGGAMKPPTMTEMRQHYLLDSGLSEERVMLAAQSPGGLHSLIQEIGDAGKFGEWAADQYGIDVYAGQSIDGWESPLQRKPAQAEVPQAPQVTAESAKAQAESEANEKHPGNGLLHINRRKKYVEGRTKELMTQGGEPARPTTDAQFDALPSGAIYIDPDDGKPYRKP